MLALPLVAAVPERFLPSSQDIIFTQLPARSAPSGSQGRIVRLSPDRAVRVLTSGFHSAADPEVSFDAGHILFAGKRSAADAWQIFEMEADGANPRQITHEPRDCRSPIYQSQLFTLDAEKPWRQIAFVENGSLYSVRLDGTGVRRLTYSGARDRDPVLAPDGRMVFAQGGALAGINLDGTDYALFSRARGKLDKSMPAITTSRLVVFVESAGRLATVSLRRPLHSYRPVPVNGVFHSPSPLPDGQLLVSKRASTYGIHRLDPESGTMSAVYDDPNWQDVQARLLEPRTEPDGRSSVVDEASATAKLYCLSVNTTDVAGPKPRRLRVTDASGRVMGEIDLEADGSFHIEVPAATPVRLHTLDAKGAVLRSSAAIWAMNKENRGCIGCHEDGELAPENRVAIAVTHAATPLSKGGK